MVLWRVCIAISGLVMRDAGKSSASHKKHDYQSSRTHLSVYGKQLHDVASEGCKTGKIGLKERRITGVIETTRSMRAVDRSKGENIFSH